VRATDVNNFLAVKRLDLFRTPLSVAVAVTEFPVVAVAPRKHLPTFGQRHTVPVRTDRGRQLYRHEP